MILPAVRVEEAETDAIGRAVGDAGVRGAIRQLLPGRAQRVGAASVRLEFPADDFGFPLR